MPNLPRDTLLQGCVKKDRRGALTSQLGLMARKRAHSARWEAARCLRMTLSTGKLAAKKLVPRRRVATPFLPEEILAKKKRKPQCSGHPNHSTRRHSARSLVRRRSDDSAAFHGGPSSCPTPSLPSRSPVRRASLPRCARPSRGAPVRRTVRRSRCPIPPRGHHSTREGGTRAARPRHCCSRRRRAAPTPQERPSSALAVGRLDPLSPLPPAPASAPSTADTRQPARCSQPPPPPPPAMLPYSNPAAPNLLCCTSVVPADSSRRGRQTHSLGRTHSPLPRGSWGFPDPDSKVRKPRCSGRAPACPAFARTGSCCAFPITLCAHTPVLTRTFVLTRLC
jgi:hypothetical protein